MGAMPDHPSATPQARKLGLKSGQRVALDEAPTGWGITDPPEDLIAVGDITDNVVRAQALPLGLVDVKIAAIDDDWSGLRLVWRVVNRTGPPAGPDGSSPPTPRGTSR